jgi:hypothetical protein
VVVSSFVTSFFGSCHFNKPSTKIESTMTSSSEVIVDNVLNEHVLNQRFEEAIELGDQPSDESTPYEFKYQSRAKLVCTSSDYYIVVNTVIR